MKHVKKGVLAALVIALGIGPGVPAANAASTYDGGCGNFAQGGNASNGWRSTGYVWAEFVVYSNVATDNPVSATVTCTIKVNGVTQVNKSFSGTGVVAGAAAITLVFHGNDLITDCTTIDYTSNGDPTVTWCEDRVVAPCDDTLDCLSEAISQLTAVGDPLLCPVLGALSPGVGGILDIDETGDVSVLGISFWDCPPYGS